MASAIAASPGDYVLADGDGIVCIPRDIVDEVTDEATRAMATASKVRTAIMDGIDPREAYLTYGKF